MTLRSCTLSFEELEDRTLPSVSIVQPAPIPPPPVGDSGDWNPLQPPWAGQHVALAVGYVEQLGQDEVVSGSELLDQVALDLSATNPNFRQEVLAQDIDPRTVQLADLTGSGRLDLVVADSAGNRILVYLNLGNGQFAPAQSFATGSNPVGITIADLNGDGSPDIVVANEGSNTVSLFFGEQTAAGWSLVSGPQLPVGAGPVFTFVRDVTGNGVPDLFVADSLSNDVYQLQGLGGGAFDVAHPIVYPVGVSPQLVFVGHFSDEATLDLVSVNAGSDDLTFFADPTFTSAPGPGRSIPIPLGQEPDAAIMHRDNDGDDLAVASYASGSVNILVPTADGPVVAETMLLPNQVHPTDMALSSDGSSLFVAGTGPETVVQLAWPGNPNPTGLDGPNSPGPEAMSGPNVLVRAPALPQPNGEETGDGGEPAANLLPLSDSHLAVVATSAIVAGSEGVHSRPALDCPCFATGIDRNGELAEGPTQEDLAAVAGQPGWLRFASGQDTMLLRQRAEARERLHEEDPATDSPDPERSALDRFFRMMDIPGTAGPGGGLRLDEDWQRYLRHLATWLNDPAAAEPPSSSAPDPAPFLDCGPLPLLDSRKMEEPPPSTWEQSRVTVFSILTLAAGLASAPLLKRRRSVERSRTRPLR